MAAVPWEFLGPLSLEVFQSSQAGLQGLQKGADPSKEILKGRWDWQPSSSSQPHLHLESSNQSPQSPALCQPPRPAGVTGAQGELWVSLHWGAGLAHSFRSELFLSDTLFLLSLSPTGSLASAQGITHQAFPLWENRVEPSRPGAGTPGRRQSMEQWVGPGFSIKHTRASAPPQATRCPGTHPIHP